MYRRINLAPAKPAPADALAIVLFDKTTELPAGYARLDTQTGGAISAMLKRGEFSAPRGGLITLYPTGGKDVPERLYILGLGDRAKFTPDALRFAAARLVKAAFAAKVQRLTLRVEAGLEGKLNLTPGAAGGTPGGDAAGQALADGLAIANFEFDTFKGAAGGKNNGNGSASANASSKPIDLTLDAESSLRAGLERGLAICESVNLTRTLQATPPNVAHTQYVADFSRRMAREVGLKCTVIDAARAKRLNMGGLLAVGAAGSHPPSMIVLEWEGSRGQGAKGSRGRSSARSGSSPSAPGPLDPSAPILLVGKAITFDTGGISIKPADNMDKMKYDKSGGMAVIGAMHAIARLKLPRRVVGIVPCAENMLGEKAYRPGDILTHHNGVTSEILNTDAEGRLVLADALAYGTRTYQPQAVIDLATLTGACVVALGTVCAGAFCGDMSLRSHLFDAAEYTGERLWHMPLWDEHRQQIKGTHGDIVNAGGREAGACTAAAFLSFFIEPDGPRKLPESAWCHLDIAGVADVKSDTGLFAKGPTGFGVRLLVRAIETWDRKQPKRGLPAQPGAAAALQQPRNEGNRRAVGVPADRG